MDITLERILTLIPKKPDGKYVHGAKKEFATNIGYTDGQIVSMWENGTSSSYTGKLHEIAMKYNVSVEWLKGETDIRQKEKPATESEPIGPAKQKLLDAVDDMSPAEMAILFERIQKIKESRI